MNADSPSDGMSFPPATGVRAWKVRVAGRLFAIISLPVGVGPLLPVLTLAERDVADRVLRGESNREVAQGRGTSERTVANQLAAIYQKLGVASRAELAVYVTRLQLGFTDLRAPSSGQ